MGVSIALLVVSIVFLSIGFASVLVGIIFFLISRNLASKTSHSVTGKITEVCYYPFSLIYRDSGMNEKRKSVVSELLDSIGKWLEKKEIVVDNEIYKLENYPTLTGDREFLEINRQTTSYLANTYEDRSEDWKIRITARYKNEYK